MPAGYEELTVAGDQGAGLRLEPAELEAALEYEQAHGKRKGAIAALETALTEKEQS